MTYGMKRCRYFVGKNVPVTNQAQGERTECVHDEEGDPGITGANEEGTIRAQLCE